MPDPPPATAPGAAETTKSEAAQAAATPSDDKAKPTETATGEVKSSPASVSANAEEPKADMKADAKPADGPKSTEKAAEKPAEPANTATEAPAKKDVSRLPGQEKPK